ncbi:MAG: hypothetical protein GY754_06490 [bacterium]|nr:hypothetical protein [bacterium]
MKIFNLSIISLLVISVLAFSGCEEGLSAGNDSVDDSGESGFSFSDMYSKIKSLQEEVEALKLVNQAQADTINSRVLALEGHVGDSASSLDSRIDSLEGHVGNSASSLDSRIDNIESYVGNVVASPAKSVSNRLVALEGHIGNSGTSLDSRIDTLESKVGNYYLSSINEKIDDLEDNIGSVSIEDLSSDIDILKGSGISGFACEYNNRRYIFWNEKTDEGYQIKYKSGYSGTGFTGSAMSFHSTDNSTRIMGLAGFECEYNNRRYIFWKEKTDEGYQIKYKSGYSGTGFTGSAMSLYSSY